jgi:lipoprotein-releasing system ATP-binding protein
LSEPVLSIRGLERTYITMAGALPVLRGVDLDVMPARSSG